jgi:F-type H+-transporting ATPase subunit gamma
MSALGETQVRIESIRKLKTVVGALRGIAATHAQQARGALEGYRAYAAVVADGLGRAVSLLDPDAASGASAKPGPAALVAYTAEHGFAGAFSVRVLDAVGPVDDATKLFVLGSRGAALAEQRGWRVEWSGAMASQASGVAEAARGLADVLYAGFVREGLASAEMVYARSSGGADVEIVRRRVLPIDLPALRPLGRGPPPLANLPPARLVEQLIGEYVFAELALAGLESFAGENAARLATMESARLNIDQKLDELTAQERLLRQEQITAEVQDVVAGALAADRAM